jgi:tetratricopeptide (TPR) repeat protein
VQVRPRSLSRLAPLLLLAARVAVAQPATPDCPEGDATLCGRKHFELGAQAFEKGDYAASVSEFQAALSQRPHPVIRFNLALALARLGRPSAAIEQLRQVRGDAESDKELRARAEREQKSAEQALARVTFRLSDPKRERVELDGAGVELGAPGELALDPGSHHVRVISNSSVVLDQDLDLSPGERVELRVGERSRRIDVVVVPDAAPPKAAARKAQPVPVPPARAKLPRAYFYAGMGATVVLGGITLWSGLDTNSAHDDYERDRFRLDRSELQARLNDGHALERRTNLLLAGTLVAGAGTAVLGIWFTDFSGKPSAALGVGPGRVSLAGSF